MGTNAGFTPPGVPECPYAPRMTRAAALALRAANGLLENCVVVITDGPTIGNAITGTSPTEIELNPVAPDDLGLTARVNTTFDDSAWDGLYDIDGGTNGVIFQLEDNLGNVVKDVDIAADSPTVHTVFPWGVATWRDNYMEDWVAVTPVVGAVNLVTNNRFVGGQSLDMTGWVGPAFNGINNCEFTQTGVLAIKGGSIWSRSKVNGGAVNCVGGGRINLTDATLLTTTLTNNATVDSKRLEVTRSLVSTGTVTQNSDVGGNLSISDSEVRASTLTIAAGAFKAIGVTSSKLTGVILNSTGGTVLRSAGISQSEIAGANTITHTGDGGFSILRCRVTIFQPWTIDGAGATGLNALDSTIQGVRIVKGPASNRLEFSRAVLSGGAILQNGSGDLSVGDTQGAAMTIDQQAGSTGELSLQGCLFRGGGTVTMLPACTRDSSFLSCSITQFSTVDLSGTGVLAPFSDRFDQMDLVSGHFVFSAAGGNGIAVVARTRLLGGSEVGSGTLTISGNTVNVRVDQCEIEGVVTIDNELGLTNPISFSGNKVGQGSTILVQGGDAAVRQIQNNVVNGRSTLAATNLTGTAGPGLGDIFSCNVDGQSALDVVGARVAGQPVRNVEAINGADVNVDANGTLLQCSFRNGAVINTGAFRHSESVIEGAITKTATAANTNRLANKSFDDWI